MSILVQVTVSIVIKYDLELRNFIVGPAGFMFSLTNESTMSGGHVVGFQCSHNEETSVSYKKRRRCGVDLLSRKSHRFLIILAFDKKWFNKCLLFHIIVQKYTLNVIAASRIIETLANGCTRHHNYHITSSLYPGTMVLASNLTFPQLYL